MRQTSNFSIRRGAGFIPRYRGLPPGTACSAVLRRVVLPSVRINTQPEITMKGNRTYLTVAVGIGYLIGAKLGFWAADKELLSMVALAAVAFLRAAVPGGSGDGGKQSLAPGLRLLLGLLIAGWASSAVAQTDPFAPKQFSVSPFASYRVRNFDGVLERFGGGLAVGYSFSRNLTLEAETLSEGVHRLPLQNSITEAGLNLKSYVPLGTSGLAPYALIGYTHGFKPVEESRFNAGAGLELRAKYLAVFADGRWTHDFRNVGHALFRVGASIRW